MQNPYAEMDDRYAEIDSESDESDTWIALKREWGELRTADVLMLQTALKHDHHWDVLPSKLRNVMRSIARAARAARKVS